LEASGYEADNQPIAKELHVSDGIALRSTCSEVSTKPNIIQINKVREGHEAL
jgi:hypothetical protein